MWRVNVNKLFPRLSIRVKLAIAFVAVAMAPLVVVGAIGTRSALEELTQAAEADLGHDVELAYAQTARAIREIEQHLAFLQAIHLGEGADGVQPAAGSVARTYLVADSSALMRVKVLDADGERVAMVARPGIPPPDGSVSDEPFYHWLATRLPEGGSAMRPVEFYAGTRDDGTPAVVPAVAVVRPIYRDGRYAGALVGEADASALFRFLEVASPGLEGVSGMVDEDGLYLFHTEFKRDWSALLANRTDRTLFTELGDSVARLLLRGGAEGVVRTRDGNVVAYRRLASASPGDGLVVYRVVPLTKLRASVRRFVGGFSVLGLALMGLVFAASLLAARQITRPVYRLQAAARRLGAGEALGPLGIETNDELEDLAQDFRRMASVLERHRAELETLVEERTRQLSRAEEELRQVVTLSADAIIGTDPGWRVRLWNRGAEDLFGYTSDEAMGKPLADLIGPAPGEHPVEASYFQAALASAGSVSNYRTTRRDRGGQCIPVTLTTTALRDEAGGLAGYSVILRDDRAREKLEEQMRRSERLSAISVMAAGLAHEINNPLAVLGNRVELMLRQAKKESRDPALIRDLEVLGRSVSRIGAVTGDLLRFARDESDLIAPVDAGEVVERVSRLLKRTFAAADVELVVHAEADLPRLMANESALETVLVNLLLNARQATPAGGTVRVETRRHEVDPFVVVAVEDSGPGVPRDLWRRIFEPFFTTKAEHGGTGLGLAVCRTLVDRCGGQIEVGNSELGGASFVLLFPQQAGMGMEARPA